MKKKFLLILLALVSALCLAFGLTACGKTKDNDGPDTPDHTHSFTWVYNDDATCTADGTETERCDSCDETGETRVKEGTKLGHNMHEVQASEATCTEDGVIYHWHCDRCGLDFQDEDGETHLENVITEPKFGHEMREVQGREVTCTVDGIVYHWHCDRCELDFQDEDGETQLETVVKEMLGHDMVQLPAQEATCAESGYASHIGCSRCGYTEESIEYTDDALHVKYELSDDHYIVSDLDSACADTEIVIPSTYKGLPVTEIGYEAFMGCSSLESIIIPASVTSIGGSAFWECSSLESVTFDGDSKLTSIGGSTFYNCSLLQSVTFEGNSKLTSIEDSAFYNCRSLTSITIPASVTSIGKYAFRYCYKLIEVWNDSALPLKEGDEGYGYVAYYAKLVYTVNEQSKQTVTDDGYIFYEDGIDVYLLGYKGNETSLTLPTISPSGKDYAIYQYAFYGCSSLTSITIPEGVTEIGDYAFYYCVSLQTVMFEGDSKLISIGNYAFAWCSSLTNVTIPANVTSIGSNAFDYCNKLTRVTFERTDGWKVSKNSDMSNAKDISVSDPQTAAKYLTNYNYYKSYYWKRY